MDNHPKKDTEENPFSALLSDPAILSRLSGVMDMLKKGEAQQSSNEDSVSVPTSSNEVTASEISSILSSPAVAEKLPDVLAALTPMLGNGIGAKKATSDKKTALLKALRPYLSEGRCEAIDYITRIEKLGDVVKNLKL